VRKTPARYDDDAAVLNQQVRTSAAKRHPLHATTGACERVESADGKTASVCVQAMPIDWRTLGTQTATFTSPFAFPEKVRKLVACEHLFNTQEDQVFTPIGVLQEQRSTAMALRNAAAAAAATQYAIVAESGSQAYQTANEHHHESSTIPGDGEEESTQHYVLVDQNGA
jgi:hypothetical protein